MSWINVDNWISFNADYLTAVTVAKVGEMFEVRAFLADGMSSDGCWTLKTFASLAQAEQFKDKLVVLAGGNSGWQIVSAGE